MINSGPGATILLAGSDQGQRLLHQKDNITQKNNSALINL
jgi:hypothetical protein